MDFFSVGIPPESQLRGTARSPQDAAITVPQFAPQEIGTRTDGFQIRPPAPRGPEYGCRAAVTNEGAKCGNRVVDHHRGDDEPGNVRWQPRLQASAEQLGYDRNRWFGNVEVAVAKVVGCETPRYVANVTDTTSPTRWQGARKHGKRLTRRGLPANRPIEEPGPSEDHE